MSEDKGVQYEISKSGEKTLVFKSMAEYQAYLRSKQNPQIPKLEQELKELEEKEQKAFDHARDTYKEITLQNMRIADAAKTADKRVVDSLEQDLARLHEKPEVIQHREIVAKIQSIETRLQGLRSKK